MGSPRRGAYGLHLPDLAAAEELLVPAPADWASWSVEVVVSWEALAAAREPRATLTADVARSAVSGGNWMVADRRRATTTLYFGTEPLASEIVHPYFSLSAGVTAFWAGHVAFHASALLGAEGAWAVLGPRGSGKSTLMASWAADGCSVVTDDVLVVRDGMALAGPRTIDLRADAGSRHDAEALGVVGARERYRLRASTVEPMTRLAGFLLLEWGDRVELIQVPYEERVGQLVRGLTLHLPPLNPGIIGDLARLPMWSLRRPRDPAVLDRTVECVRTVTG